MAELAAVRPNDKDSPLDINRNVIKALKLCLKQKLQNIELGELVDEDIRTQHGNGSQFADPGIIKQHVEEITTSAIEKQEDSNLNLLLKAESSVFLLAVLERNQKNRKNAEEFMSNLLQKLTNEYQNKLKEFVDILSPFAIEKPIILQSFHNKTTEKLLKKYDTLSKPGSDAFILEHKECLLAELDKIMSTELATVKPNQDKPTQLATDKAFIDNLQSQIQSLLLENKLISTQLKFHKLPDVLQKSINQHDITDNVIIGIDIGSKHCHSAVCIAGKVYKIPHFDQSGTVYQSMSTYVGVDEFEAFVGQSAKNIVGSSVEFSKVFYDVIHYLRHEIYEGYNNETKYINLGFIPNYENTETIRSVLLANNKRYIVKTILSKLFCKLRDNASQFLNVTVSKCVIAYDGVSPTAELQLSVIKNAAEIGGFKKITFLSEDDAAGISLVPTTRSFMTPKNIFFINFGSRYWDFSVFEILQGNFQVKNFRQITMGLMFDTGYVQNHLANYCLEEFSALYKIPLSNLKTESIDNTVRFRRLHESCEKAMISLSASETASIHITNFFEGKDIFVNITRAKLEDLNAGRFSEIATIVDDRLTNANLKIENIEMVIITGGCSRIPKVQEIVRNLFGDKILDLMGMDPDEVVAYGAAIHGATLE